MLKPLSSSLSLGLLLVFLAGMPAAAQVVGAASKPVQPASQADANGPAWRSLTATQRKNLAPLERDWPGMGAASKAKWLEVSLRFATMPIDEQQRVMARMAEWARLTPAERGQARLSFQEKKALTPEQKQQRWEAYQALPDDHRKALAAKAQPADERKRSTPIATAASAPPPDEPPVKRPAPPAATAAKAPVKPVTSLIVQAKPGATTTLITHPATPPAHQLPGQPMIAAKPGQVDDKTLLPKSGPQASASAASAASAAPAASPASAASTSDKP